MSGAALALAATNMRLHAELQDLRAVSDIARCQPSRASVGLPQGVRTHSTSEARSVARPEGRLAVVGPGAASRTHEAVAVAAPPTAPDATERARSIAALRFNMSGLLRELALPAQQESQVLEVLSAQQDELATAVDTLVNDRDAMAQEMAALQERHQTELMAVLDSQYPVFEEYQRNIGEHAQLEEAARLLEAAGVPLRDDQQRRLLDVMVEELDGPRQRPSSIAGAAPEQEALEEQREWQDDYEERIRTRVSAALSSEQLKQLNVFWRLQSMQRQRQLEIWNDSTTASNGPGSCFAMSLLTSWQQLTQSVLVPPVVDATLCDQMKILRTHRAAGRQSVIHAEGILERPQLGLRRFELLRQ